MRVAVPSIRDLGVATFELSGWAVMRVLSLVARSGTSEPGGLLAGLTVVGVLVLGLVGATTVGWKALVLWIIPAVIVVIHASDLARMRTRLQQAAQPPYPMPPTITEEAATRSPVLAAMHRTARVVSLAFRGQWLDAENEARNVSRRCLDEQGVRLLDAACSLVALHAGDRGRAARTAILALPSGNDAVDRELGLCVLADAWEDGDRLAAIARGWGRAETTSELAALGRLAIARLSAKSGRQPWEGMPRDAIESLARDARAVGDEGLADRLISSLQPGGPYR